MSTTPRARRHELDHLRVLATLGVILLHTGAIVVVAWQDSAPDLVSNFNVGNLADGGGRFAVNCFFMTSGALLLDPVRRFVLRPQFLRVAIPTLTWIITYAIANVVLNAQGFRGVGGRMADPEATPASNLISSLLAGPAVYHLWFVYALLGIYLVVPLLRALTDRPEPEQRRLLVWFVTLWCVAELLPRWGQFFFGEWFPDLYRLPFEPMPVGYAGLFVVGYLLSHYRDRIFVPPAAWVAVAATGLVWTVTATWWAARNGDPDVFAAYGNFHPPVLMFSIGVFAFFVCRERGPGPVWPLVLRFSELSFRIYLVHALVLHTLRVATGLGTLVEEDPVIGVPVIYVLTVALSVLIAWLLDLVPVLRRWS